MHLVDAHRLVPRIGRRASLEPRLVTPGVLASETRSSRSSAAARRRTRTGRPRSERPTVGTVDLELVARPGLDSGDEELPDPGATERAQRMHSPVPDVEVADDGDASAHSAPRRRTPRRRRHRNARGCAPSRSCSSSWRPSAARCRSSAPSVGGNEYGSWIVSVWPSGYETSST